MIDFTTTRSLIETLLQNNFTECPVKMENVPLDTKNLPAWIAVFDKSSASESTGMNEETYKMDGNIIIQINTTLGIGTKLARAIAKALSDLLNSTELEGIFLQNPELYSAPQTDTWYRHHLLIRYTTIMGQTTQC